jgi:tripartite-type tricarboxylate transporter receptor subunit TctC
VTGTDWFRDWQALAQSGLEPANLSGERFEPMVKAERAQWGALIRQLGISVE